MERSTPLAATTFTAGTLVTLFWALYFTGAADLGQHDPVKRTFEAAFPVADAVLAAALFAAAVAELRRRPVARFYLVIAASMSLYLGLLDATFYLSHGFYQPFGAQAVTALVINLLCVGGGALGLAWVWRRWRRGLP